MKKVVFASLMVLASMSLVCAPSLRAQDLTIQNPAEYNAYQSAITQTDAKAKASALEKFLTDYPQTIVKKAVLSMLVDTYQGLNDFTDELVVTKKLLQIDPNNEQAIFLTVYIEKGNCAKNSDAQTCDDAEVDAKKGLAVTKPAATSDADWKKATDTAYPLFHSAIALDDALSKKDFKAAEDEYKAELMLYSDDQSKSAGLADTYQLAEAYVQPGTGQDLVKAIYFYARTWDFAPASFKGPIEKKLEYWYKKYHGKLEGLDAVKAKAALTTFPPADFAIAPAPTPAEQIHALLISTPDLKTLALSDKETILALGTKDDADKLWAVMKDQPTPVPGTVISTAVTVLKVAVNQGVKKTDFDVNLKAPMAPKDIPDVSGDLSAAKAFILSNGVAGDMDKLTALFGEDTKPPVTKIVVEAPISIIRVAVTDDAKMAKIPDFIVKLKEPLSPKEAPEPGFEFGLQSKNQAELDGTYDSYRQVPPQAATPATATTPATAATEAAAEIVLREGFVQAEKKKAVPVHKPAAGHRPAAR
jgi:hypothetical protein